MRSMLSPRPWMPLRRHRFELGYTVVPRTARIAPHEGNGRARTPTAVVKRRRGLFRRTPSDQDLRRLLDRRTAAAKAWVAELKENGDDRGGRPLR